DQSLVVFITRNYVADEFKHLREEFFGDRNVRDQCEKKDYRRRDRHYKIVGNRRCTLGETCCLCLQKEKADNIKQWNTLESGQANDLTLPDQKTDGRRNE